MSTVYSYAVGNGDMFSINHNSDSFTIIDCSMSIENRYWILSHLKQQSRDRGIYRLISTHPDQDHMMGLEYLDRNIPITNFYCVKNRARKDDITEDFRRYCELRDGGQAFNLSMGCSRRWLNISDQQRDGAGISVLWPDVDNVDFQLALREAAQGRSPNNISPIIQYSVANSGTFLWMGDLETDFLEKIGLEVTWPHIDILFAPHHGRKSGRIPASILASLDPKIIIVGEAPSQHLNYYGAYNTITQNSAGSITFECVDGFVHIYVSNDGYNVNFLSTYSTFTNANYIGTLDI